MSLRIRVFVWYADNCSWWLTRVHQFFRRWPGWQNSWKYSWTWFAIRYYGIPRSRNTTKEEYSVCIVKDFVSFARALTWTVTLTIVRGSKVINPFHSFFDWCDSVWEAWVCFRFCYHVWPVGLIDSYSSLAVYDSSSTVSSQTTCIHAADMLTMSGLEGQACHKMSHSGTENLPSETRKGIPRMSYNVCFLTSSGRHWEVPYSVTLCNLFMLQLYLWEHTATRWRWSIQIWFCQPYKQNISLSNHKCHCYCIHQVGFLNIEIGYVPSIP